MVGFLVSMRVPQRRADAVPAARLCEVGKVYGNGRVVVAVLDHVCPELAGGTFTAVTWPSGSWTSTYLTVSILTAMLAATIPPRRAAPIDVLAVIGVDGEGRVASCRSANRGNGRVRGELRRQVDATANEEMGSCDSADVPHRESLAATWLSTFASAQADQAPSRHEIHQDGPRGPSRRPRERRPKGMPSLGRCVIDLFTWSVEVRNCLSMGRMKAGQQTRTALFGTRTQRTRRVSQLPNRTACDRDGLRRVARCRSVCEGTVR
jgi:hypothetical protein